MTCQYQKLNFKEIASLQVQGFNRISPNIKQIRGFLSKTPLFLPKSAREIVRVVLYMKFPQELRLISNNSFSSNGLLHNRNGKKSAGVFPDFGK
jgi:hypothetical protein